MDKNENVEITGDARQLAKTYDVTGSAGSELLHELNLHKQMNTERVDSLSTVYTASRGKPGILKVKAALDSIYKVIVNDEKTFRRDSLIKTRFACQPYCHLPAIRKRTDVK